MTPKEILNDMYTDYSEYLEMMNDKEKFIIIQQALAQKLAFEIAEKEYYKKCFEATFSLNKRINS